MRAPVQQRMIGWPGAPVYAQAPTRSRRGQLSHLILLLLIIAFGAVLRFLFLSRPPIWGDESSTLGRTIGTFQQLCQILPTDGFAPFHYELYWWLHNHFIMTPFMMRLVPTIAGILTIPAMYFLARMLATRRVALLAALFTACSAWMLNYSRDAKMYSELWLFCTLNYACFLWWCKNKQPLAWWCFVVTGVAMLGLDALGFIVIGVELLWYITQRRVHWLSSLAYLLALAIMLAGPIGYFHYFSDWHRQNVDWTTYNLGQTGMGYLVNLVAPFLYCYQFHGEAFSAPGVPSVLVMKIAVIGVTLAAAIVILGALPWRARRSAAGAGSFELGAPPDEPARPRTDPARNRPGSPSFSSPPVAVTEIPAEPWWRVLLWLLAATFVPAYGWYCLTMSGFATPADWMHGIDSLMHGLWPWFIISTAVVGAFCMARRQLSATLAVLLVIFLILFIGASLQQGAWTDVPVILASLGSLLILPWFLVASLAVSVALLWYYCAPRGFAQMKSSILFLCAAIAIDLIVAFLVALIMSLVLASAQPQSLGSQDLLHRWTALLLNPLILLLAMCLPIFISAARGSVDMRKRLLRWSAFLGVIAAILLICQGIAMCVHPLAQTVWVPRYLGAIWPPACVGLMILLDRLPTRGMVAAALIALIGLNLFSFSARVFADTEPPVGRMVQDITLAHQSNGRILTLTQMGNHAWGGPGFGSLFNDVGTYYEVLSRWENGQSLVSPQEYRNRSSPVLYDFINDASAGMLHRQMAANPHLRRVIIWTDSPAGPQQTGDPFIAYLGPEWKLVHHNHWTGRTHWTWKDLYLYDRWEYQRVTPGK